MEVKLEGQAQLFAAFDKFGGEARKQATEGLKKAGMWIVADAQENLRRSGNNTTGRLSNSGGVRETDDGSVEAGFMKPVGDGGHNYAEFLETGTKPHRVSGRWLAAWASKKFGIYPADGPEARSAGWAIAKIIAKRGTKAHPYFTPAVKRNERRVVEAVKTAIEKAINDNTI